MTNRILPVFFILFPFLSLVSGWGAAWEDRVEVYPENQSLTAPDGYRILDASRVKVLKELPGSQAVTVRARLEEPDGEYFVSDWSWSRYQSHGTPPNWIQLHHAETGEMPTDQQSPEPVIASPAPPEPHPVRPDASGQEDVAAEALPEPEPVKAPESEPEPEQERPAIGNAEVPDVSAKAPTTLAERIEETWGGRIEVFPKERDLTAPKGYRILSNPAEGGKVLKRLSSRATLGVKAVLSLPDGERYYISGWSWERATKGSAPTWIHTGTDDKLAAGAGSARPAPEKEQPEPEVIHHAAPDLRPTDVEKPARAVVILVGNGSYSTRNPAMVHLDLSTPSPDIALLGEVFKRMGADVRLVGNGTRAEIFEEIRLAAASLGPNDSVVFYYTGHAVQIQGRNFLAPADISFVDKDRVRATAVAVDEVIGEFASRPHRLTTVVLDASRPNPFNSVDASTHLSRLFASIRSVTAQTPSGLAEIKPSGNTLVAFSAAPGGVSESVPRRGDNPSEYAKALASALHEGLEIRAVLDRTSGLVRQQTAGKQTPWRSPGPSALFYPHLPSRRIVAPDEDALAAGQWLQKDIEQGFPFALARLAYSVRRQPSGNPSAAALLYLLSYQAVPIPLQSWGPFKVTGNEFDPGLKASLDGTFIGLFPAKGENPLLIMNRHNGGTVTSIHDTFVPSQESTRVVSRQTNLISSADGQPVTTWSIHRDAWDGGMEEALPADPRATAPIIRKGLVIASWYDEGLERVYLATQETVRGNTGIYFWEYAVTPPVTTLPDVLRHRQARVASAPPGSGPVELAKGADSSWRLLLTPDGHVSLVDKSGSLRYRRADGLLDDWLVSDSGASVLLLFRDQFEILSLDGKARSTLPTPWPVDHRGSLLAFSPSFSRIFASHLPEGGRPDEAHIVALDATRGTLLSPERKVRGYSEFAAISGDGEWFFFYDEGRRLRMWDSATAGAGIDLPSTRLPAPLPVPGEVCETDPLFIPTFKATNPPLVGQLPDNYSSPTWLPDLAEALAGFRITPDGTVEWIPNATQKLRDTAKAMQKQGRNTGAGEWASWFLEHRLRAVHR